ncbi:uncharacterized protein [Lolium perenne]|uniref:uncharacterized protein isoform X2 n=1 Tax=Lolium perenne TaxID=4522 RepID=UPI003A9A071B
MAQRPRPCSLVCGRRRDGEGRQCSSLGNQSWLRMEVQRWGGDQEQASRAAQPTTMRRALANRTGCWPTGEHITLLTPLCFFLISLLNGRKTSSRQTPTRVRRVREMEKEKTKGQGDGRGCKKELRSNPTREAWPLHLVSSCSGDWLLIVREIGRGRRIELQGLLISRNSIRLHSVISPQCSRYKKRLRKM